MKTLIVWDFDNTLANRKNGKWSKTLSEIAFEKAGEIVDPQKFSPLLKTGFFWNNWENPHSHISSEEKWWDEMRPLFEDAFERLSLPKYLADFVREYYTDASKWELAEGATDVLSYFEKKGFAQAVLSNHVPELHFLIEALGIGRFFEKIYTSAQTGYEKPHQKMFDIVKNDFAGFENIWIVGDSLTADIEGGKKAGFKTCWVNHEKKEVPDSLQIDCVVSQLEEIIT